MAIEPEDSKRERVGATKIVKEPAVELCLVQCNLYIRDTLDGSGIGTHG